MLIKSGEKFLIVKLVFWYCCKFFCIYLTINFQHKMNSKHIYIIYVYCKLLSRTVQVKKQKNLPIQNCLKPGIKCI